MPIYLIHEGSLGTADRAAIVMRTDVLLNDRITITPSLADEFRHVRNMKLRELVRHSRKEWARHAAEVTREQAAETRRRSADVPQVYLSCNTKRRKHLIRHARGALPVGFPFYQGEF